MEEKSEKKIESKKHIDPYSSELFSDYLAIAEKFGLESFKKDFLPEPNRLMRRGIVFASRDLERIRQCIVSKKPYYILTGIMPTSERIHLGTKMVVEQVKYFQDHGGKAYVLVADMEAAAARGIPIETAKKYAMSFHIPAYIALGLDISKTTFYFQSENQKVLMLAYEFARKVTLNEFRAIYGSADPGRIMSAVTQAGDILFPQLEKKMPGIVPVGIDQDPHIRLTRDIVKRTASSHSFIAPSSIYHKFMPALNGKKKMSKSDKASFIELPESYDSFKKKISRALSGGRPTIEEHRKLGAEVEKDMAFELLKIHLIEDDKELEGLYKSYKSGKLLSGEIKALAIEKMAEFMKGFEKRLESARKNIGKIRLIRFGSPKA